MTALELPLYDSLTNAQHQGWACVFCGASLSEGGHSVGRAVSADGRSSIEVYACKGGCPRTGRARNAPNKEVR